MVESIKYETGATSAAANNLVLSVMNEYSYYQDRLHCGFGAIQGQSHRVSFRDIASIEANKQRREFGSKFKAAEITEAAKIIKEQTIEHCVEIISCDYDNSRNIEVNAREWFDKTYGNSYFSAMISIPMKDGMYRQVLLPFQYGYGSHFEFESIALLKKIGILESTNLPSIEFNMRENMRKSDMFHGNSVI